MTSPVTGPPVRHAYAWRTTVAAEHDLLELEGVVLPHATRAATHFLPDHAGVAVTLETADGETHVLGAAEPTHAAWALDRHRTGAGGRLVRYAGQDRLTGTLPVGDLLATTDIDEVVMVGAREPVAPAVLLDTQAFVRPAFTDGRIQLLVRPAPEGRVVPFEQPDPTPCCADHA